MEKPREPELKFSPITEGLGFHPFSDGLPYAPVTKSREAQAERPPADLSSGAGAPGEALDDGLNIACGEGAIRLLRLQREGRAAQDAADFLRGAPVASGTRLG